MAHACASFSPARSWSSGGYNCIVDILQFDRKIAHLSEKGWNNRQAVLWAGAVAAAVYAYHKTDVIPIFSVHPGLGTTPYTS
jgi:hypothetical protein